MKLVETCDILNGDHFSSSKELAKAWRNVVAAIKSN